MGIQRAIEMGVLIRKVLFVGKIGDADYHQALKDEVAAYGLTEIVEIRDYEEDFFKLLNSFNIVVVPSKAEPFGRITLEAQLFGRIVIGRCSGATRSLIEDKRTGLLYRPGDTEDLAGKIKWVSDNSREAEMIAAEAMAAQSERFEGINLNAPLEAAIDDIVAQYAHKKRDRSFDPLFAAMTKIENQRKEIEGIRNSRTFRTGSAILAPLQKLKHGSKD